MCSEKTRGMPRFSWVPKGFLVKVMFEIRSEGTRKEVAKHRLGREQRKGGERERRMSVREFRLPGTKGRGLARAEKPAGAHRLGLVSVLRIWVTSGKWMKGLCPGSDRIRYIIVHKDGSGCHVEQLEIWGDRVGGCKWESAGRW